MKSTPPTKQKFRKITYTTSIAFIVEFAKKYDLPFNTYSAEELNSLEGDFTKSEFVKSVVEVDNVCERSAIMESNGKLIRRKDTCDGAGVTVALAINDPNISWEK